MELLYFAWVRERIGTGQEQRDPPETVRSVADLIAANPGMKVPTGKVFVPVSGNRIETISYSRPSNASSGAPVTSARVVKAQAGDTVAKLATRHNANPTEVAKYNGLLPNSVLGAGREIKLPQSGSK